MNNNTDKEAVDEDVDLTKKSNKTDAEEAKESANKGQEANNQVSKEDTADFYDEKNAH
ncbi:hypothetical protein [Virgibacillus salinus]|uniref:hypothetical protein n=1 Tax=Virgibacillus salinus TaxID=553311 RepID=UPI00158828CC|nr:hypothetical protein [Virgibacillus salinus]